MMCKIKIESSSINGWVDEESLELLPVDSNATLFFSKGEAERFLAMTKNKAAEYNKRVSAIENDNSRSIVASFVKASVSGNLIDALMSGASVHYICV